MQIQIHNILTLTHSRIAVCLAFKGEQRESVSTSKQASFIL